MTVRLLRLVPSLSLAAVLFVAACSDQSPSTIGDRTKAPRAAATAEPDTTTTAAAADDDADTDAEAAADQDAATDDELAALPIRSGPREETTYGVPHVQLNAVPVPEVDAELRRRAFALPGVEERESELSLPGARSLWLSDDVEVVRPEVLPPGREFAHIHPNGSLHVWLPTDRAFEVADTKWGEFHPWVGRDDFWDGLVLVYTPETLDELEVTMRLIVDAYNFVTEAGIDPASAS